MSPHDLLKYVKDQYDRLAEISPMVPEIVIHEFQHKFKNQKDISKPEEANGLHKIDIYKDVDDDDSMKEMPDIKSPTASMKKVPSFLLMNPTLAASVGFAVQKGSESAYAPIHSL
jgi:hypothetical protein